jgi:hypothetical protein
MKHYNYGLRAEDRLAGAYSRRGYTTSYHERSRSPADIIVVRGGRRLHVQVKSVRSRTARIMDVEAAFDFISQRMSDSELVRLVTHAARSRGQPAVGLTNGDYYWTWRITAMRDEHIFSPLHQGWLPRLPLARQSA